MVNPQATTLPDGSLYVVWDALPVAEEGLASPLDLTSLPLQGARYYPTNQTWGVIHTFSAQGFAESYAVDATNTSGEVLELVSQQPLLNDSTAERLVEYDILTGDVIHNVSATGISEIVSFRGDPGLAIVQALSTGTDSLISLSTGSAVAISYTPPADSNLTSASFVTDSPSVLVLLYAGLSNTKLVLYNTSDGDTEGTRTVGSNASEAEGIASGTTFYVFVRTADGIHGWSVKGGVFEDLAAFARPNVGTYGLVQAGGSVVIYALATDGSVKDPTVTLWLAEIGAALPPVPVPSSAREGAASSSNTSASYLVYLAIAAGLVAVVLVAVAIRTRRRPPAAAPAPWAPPAGAVGAEPAAPASPPAAPPPSG